MLLESGHLVLASLIIRVGNPLSWLGWSCLGSVPLHSRGRVFFSLFRLLIYDNTGCLHAYLVETLSPLQLRPHRSHQNICRPDLCFLCFR